MFMYFMLLGYLKCMSFGTFLVIQSVFVYPWFKTLLKQVIKFYLIFSFVSMFCRQHWLKFHTFIMLGVKLRL